MLVYTGLPVGWDRLGVPIGVPLRGPSLRVSVKDDSMNAIHHASQTHTNTKGISFVLCYIISCMHIFILGSSNSTHHDEVTIVETHLKNVIPKHVYDLLPHSANYLKEMMTYAGYETISSVSKLESSEERAKWISFIVSMHGAMGNEEGKKVFGKFYNIPEKLMILPGLETAFYDFVKTVKKLQSSHSSSDSQSKVLKSASSTSITKSSKQKSSKQKLIKVVHTTVDDVKEKMREWFSNQNMADRSFSLSTLENDENKFAYCCGGCKWKINICRDADGKVRLSNVQRHYRDKQCSKKKSNANKVEQSKQSEHSRIGSYFSVKQFEYTSPDSGSGSSSTFVIDENSSDTQFVNHSWKNRDDEIEIEEIPKNEQASGGTQDSTETSRRL